MQEYPLQAEEAASFEEAAEIEEEVDEDIEEQAEAELEAADEPLEEGPPQNIVLIF